MHPMDLIRLIQEYMKKGFVEIMHILLCFIRFCGKKEETGDMLVLPRVCLYGITILHCGMKGSKGRLSEKGQKVAGVVSPGLRCKRNRRKMAKIEKSALKPHIS